jgi:hypothetical protein
MRKITTCGRSDAGGWPGFEPNAVGITIGIACKWLASSVFYRLIGEDVR